MDILNSRLWEVFILLFIAMGPIRITVNYIPLAKNIPPAMQRRLARRTVWVSFIVAGLIILMGQGVVRNFGIDMDTMAIAAGIAFGLSAIQMISMQPTDEPPPSRITNTMRLAISPLAVPAMISPLAVAMLMSVAAFVTDLGDTLIFLAMVLGILGMNWGAMTLSTHINHRVNRPILELFGQIFGFILLAMAARLILHSLANLGVISLNV